MRNIFYSIVNPDIQYIINPNEYKKFCGLNNFQKKIYLKKFWSKNNYWGFEKRLLESDEKFSTSFLKGRDTEMGKFYIINGPPDEIDFRPMAKSGKSSQVWIYYTRGWYILFCDSKDDGNYELIDNLSHQEYHTRDLEAIKKWLK